MPATQATTDIKQFPTLVGKGIRGILHVFNAPNQGSIDTTKNLIYGYRITGLTRGGTSIEQTDVSTDGIKALFAAGKVTGGDITLNLSYDPTMGEPPIVQPVQGITYAPQAVLWLGFIDPASVDDALELIPFIEVPVNISEFGEINMPDGQPATSSMKFKESGDGAKTIRSQINNGNNILYKGSGQ